MCSWTAWTYPPTSQDRCFFLPGSHRPCLSKQSPDPAPQNPEPTTWATHTTDEQSSAPEAEAACGVNNADKGGNFGADGWNRIRFAPT
ncbi:hypothetical protein GCM10011579_098750 [Streptomyces albiflavescens]|uniref:Uncharacterized protein n=1 Tax=Streptomyces albiflavescens TaxID=1623582 RepID=A0A917YFG1_9ACTN|nr:hypothetical protein GCM10011579_098750 [Streptomyces albiflavescens]